MKSSLIRGAWQRFKKRVIGSIVQDCPLEICACEACGHLQCTSAEWVQCGKRLATTLYLRDGDRDALALLKQIHEREGSARQPPQQAVLAGSQPEGETPSGGCATTGPGTASADSRRATGRMGRKHPKKGIACT